MRLGNLTSRLRGAAAPAVALLMGLAGVTGCETQGFIDPGEMMRTTKHTLTVPVLSSLANGVDEVEAEYTAAREVRQADLKVDATDYVIGRNDLLSIAISEVAGQGVETVKTTRVSESGNVSLPLIGTIKASGLTEAELEKVIAQTYKDKNIIQSAQVAVTVIEARQRTFSILGAVGRPGQYQIVQADFKLLDALTLAGDVQIQGIDHVYVIRKLGGNPDRPKTPAAPGGTTPPAGTTPPDTTKPPVDPLRGPQGRANGTRGPVLMTLLDEKEEAGERKVMIDGKWVPVKGTAGDAPKAAPAETVKVAAPIAPETGKVVDPLTGGTAVGGAATGGTATGRTAEVGGFQFDAPKVDTDVEIIKVPYGRLRKGDLQYNIVIRPNDTIDVPSPTVGEYYMGGHVGRPGVYSLTGRDITLKQAIISAGMIDPLGWPERTEVVRRIGKDKEIFVRVNLPQVFAGQQPDIFLRPYDVVSVGSNMVTPFLAALRGAFRFTYGFGFIYDRNYAPEQSSQN